MSDFKHKKFNFKHSLGQNFIVDEFLLEDIADESGINKDDLVLEIGPGNGALTRCLCDRAKFVVSVEIDKTLMPLLKDNLKEYNNVSIINADFMELDFQTILNEFASHISPVQDAGGSMSEPDVGANAHRMGEPRFTIKVVANLPYYITSPIINNLLQNPYVSEMTLMVQKEVAERITAKPNNKDFGILTLACNYFADTEMIMLVSKDCFFPKPKVDSAVVHFKKHTFETIGASSASPRMGEPDVGANANRMGELCEPDVGANAIRMGECAPERFFRAKRRKCDKVPLGDEPDYNQLFKLIKASFAQRRKKLLNSLTNAGYDKDTVAKALSELGFDENVRAENLSLDDYKKLLGFFS